MKKYLYVSMFCVGVVLSMGAHAEQNKKLGREFLKKGDLADRAQNYAEAEKWYLQSAAQGEIEAMRFLLVMYENGRGVQKNVVEAEKWRGELIKSALAGDGSLWEMAKDNSEKMTQLKRGKFDEYRKAAESGDARTQEALARMYQVGFGVEKNRDEALKWYILAAEQDAQGQLTLGLPYASDLMDPGGDGTNSEKWLRKSLAQGNNAALVPLAHILIQLGMFAEAVELFRQAASQEDQDAMMGLGQMYLSGRGVPQDFDEALRWYEKAAEGPFSKGASELFRIYRGTEGIEKDCAKAEKWCLKAQELGYGISLPVLKNTMKWHCPDLGKCCTGAIEGFRAYAVESGSIYETLQVALLYRFGGPCVKKDLNEARIWYRKAADLGYSPAEIFWESDHFLKNSE